jgi:sulfate adenylyltransferase subunit 1
MNMDSTLNIEILRFTTAGSVDDGKSTLIGRLLFDSKSIFEDQLESISKISNRKGLNHLDLSLLTDGLKDEREQGITIDVAYRYFATPKRKFIIADTPGHIQYTRNMVTGASTANAAVILIDARKGVIEQTYRHSFIASLLQIPHIIVCVNKMDLVNYDENVFNEIVSVYENFASKLDVQDIRFVPISALHGDNVVHRSEHMKWYEGATLMHTLENMHIGSDLNHLDPRLPIQSIIRPHVQEFHDFRSYAGRIESGVFRNGEEVLIMPSGIKTKIKAIYYGSKEITEAFTPMSVSVTISDDIDISRGDMIVKPNNQPTHSQDLEVMFCWLNQSPLNISRKYLLKQTTHQVGVVFKEIIYKLDMKTISRDETNKEISTNDIFRAKIRTTKPLLFDPYRKNRNTGSLILIDEISNETIAAGMIL